MISQCSQSKDVVTVFAHGLGGDKDQGWYYHVSSNIQNACIEGHLITFNFKDAGNPTTSCLGQDADIATLHTTCVNYENVILFGVSRGAATIANYLGTHKTQNVRAAILESPFDHVASVVRQINDSQSLPLITPAMYPNYNPHGIQPIDIADKIDLNIPLLIIASKSDSLIHYSSTVNLYNKIVAGGHKKAYLLVTETGAHANILFGPEGRFVRNVIHAFYKEQNLPHNAIWASQGEDAFKKCKLLTSQ